MEHLGPDLHGTSPLMLSISQGAWITPSSPRPCTLGRQTLGRREDEQTSLSWVVLGCFLAHIPGPSGSPGLCDPKAAPYLFCDCAGTLDELPLGVAVGGAHLEGPCLLHQEDTAVAQVLHASAYLEANLRRQPGWGRTSMMDPAIEVLPMWKISPMSYGSLAGKIPLLLGVCAW